MSLLSVTAFKFETVNFHGFRKMLKTMIPLVFSSARSPNANLQFIGSAPVIHLHGSRRYIIVATLTDEVVKQYGSYECSSHYEMLYKTLEILDNCRKDKQLAQECYTLLNPGETAYAAYISHDRSRLHVGFCAVDNSGTRSSTSFATT